MQAVVNALNNPANTPPCVCYRTRVDALSSGELPAFVFFGLEQRNQRKSQNVVLATRAVRLEAHVAGVPPQDKAADPLYQYAVKTLYADATLSGLIKGLEHARIGWTTEAGYDDVSLAALDFELVFFHRADDPAVRVEQ